MTVEIEAGELLNGRTIVGDVQVRVTLEELREPRFTAWLEDDILPRLGTCESRVLIVVARNSTA